MPDGLGSDTRKWPLSSINPGDFEVLETLIADGRVEFLDGDFEILPGVTAHLARDSHTFGSQWLEVSTRSGPYVVAGDCVYWYSNIERMWPPAYIQGDAWNLIDCYRRIRECRERRVPAHRSGPRPAPVRTPPELDGGNQPHRRDPCRRRRLLARGFRRMLRATDGVRGMVVAPHGLAAWAGLAVLREGGNAIEAMVAAAATIAVVYPPHERARGRRFLVDRGPRCRTHRDRCLRCHRRGRNDGALWRAGRNSGARPARRQHGRRHRIGMAGGACRRRRMGRGDAARTAPGGCRRGLPRPAFRQATTRPRQPPSRQTSWPRSRASRKRFWSTERRRSRVTHSATRRSPKPSGASPATGLTISTGAGSRGGSPPTSAVSARRSNARRPCRAPGGAMRSAVGRSLVGHRLQHAAADPGRDRADDPRTDRPAGPGRRGSGRFRPYPRHRRGHQARLCACAMRISAIRRRWTWTPATG